MNLLNRIREFVDDYMFKEALAILAILVALFLILVAVANRFEWVTESAHIERLRIDAVKVDSKMAEDVAGQVAEKNRTIAEKRAWRKTIFKWIVPSGWDAIDFIEMPTVRIE